MDINLKELKPQRISRNLKGKYMMFYGLPGIGKTSLAAQFPKALICGFEMGTNGLDDIYVQQILSWSDWKKVCTQLKQPEVKEKFDTIVIDTADSAWEMCVKSVCASHGVDKLGDIGWGEGWSEAKRKYAQSFKDIAELGYGIVFISHSSEKTMKDENKEEYIQINVALPQKPYDIVNKMVDLIGYIREIDLEDGTRDRYVFFRGDKRFFAKSRFKYIEPAVKFSYDNIVKAIYEAIDKQVAETGKGSAPSDAQNTYVQLDFDALIEEAKILWGQVVQQEKVEQATDILNQVFGKPTRFSEITADEVEKLKEVISQIRDIL